MVITYINPGHKDKFIAKIDVPLRYLMSFYVTIADMLTSEVQSLSSHYLI